ncbi:DUF5615 family PIN-like protein [Spirosoma gilvum]
MSVFDFALIADENINPRLVSFLKESGFDIVHVNDVNLGNTADHIILSYAYLNYRVVLTLDDDFGALVFKNKQPFVGIIRLNPGHLTGDFHIPTLKAILSSDLDYQPPFLLVAEKRSDHIHIRYRSYAS